MLTAGGLRTRAGQVRLIYLKASPDCLRRRLRLRSLRRDANAAFEIHRH